MFLSLSVSRLIAGADESSSSEPSASINTASSTHDAHAPATRTLPPPHDAVPTLSKSPVEHDEIMPHPRLPQSKASGQLTLTHQQMVHDIQPSLSIGGDTRTQNNMEIASSGSGNASKAAHSQVHNSIHVQSDTHVRIQILANDKQSHDQATNNGSREWFSPLHVHTVASPVPAHSVQRADSDSPVDRNTPAQSGSGVCISK
jgi:hypothetical protein